MPIRTEDAGITLDPVPGQPSYGRYGSCGQYRVHFAIDANPGGRYEGKQSDRAAIFELREQITEPQLADIVASVSSAAIARAKSIPRLQSGSTWTLAAFDPKSEHLYLSTAGDSPAYIVMSDGKQESDLLRISFGADNLGNTLVNSLGQTQGETVMHTPVFHSEQDMNFTTHSRDVLDIYQADCANNRPYIDLREVRDLAKKRGFDVKRLSLRLVLASDGIDKLAPRKLSAIAADESPGNKARALIDEALKAGSKDNITATIIPLQTTGFIDATQPIMGCVCDGYGNQGHIVADAAIHVFEHCMERLQGPSQAPGVLGRA